MSMQNVVVNAYMLVPLIHCTLVMFLFHNSGKYIKPTKFIHEMLMQNEKVECIPYGPIDRSYFGNVKKLYVHLFPVKVVKL